MACCKKISLELNTKHSKICLRSQLSHDKTWNSGNLAKGVSALQFSFFKANISPHTQPVLDHKT